MVATQEGTRDVRTCDGISSIELFDMFPNEIAAVSWFENVRRPRSVGLLSALRDHRPNRRCSVGQAHAVALRLVPEVLLGACRDRLGKHPPHNGASSIDAITSATSTQLDQRLHWPRVRKVGSFATPSWRLPAGLWTTTPCVLRFALLPAQ